MQKQVFLSISMLALCAGIASVVPAQAAVTAASGNAPPATTTAPVLTSSTSGYNLTSLVANSCEMPKLSKTRQAFYVDPVHGNIKNDGSAAHPWDTLANVMVQKKSVIQGGDVIYLLTGNHGKVSAHKVNTDFVEVMPAPGQTPVLTSLSVSGAKWLFTGLKIQGLAGGAHVSIASAWDAPGAANNIIITNNIINSQDDTSSWTKAQWRQNAGSGISVDGRGGTNCLTITGNKIASVILGTGIFADQSLFAYNTIDRYADDAVEYGGNNLTLSNNKITNVIDVGDGQHNDCFQGLQPGGSGYNATSYTNVTIDSNICIRQTDPGLHFATYFQGIDNFSGRFLDWYNLTVTNNVVITNHPQGISFGSIHNALIANNTVLADGEVTTSEYDTASGLVLATVGGGASWIQVSSINNGIYGHPSDHVDVRNNIAQTLNQGTGTDPTVIFENNISSLQVALFQKGKMAYYNKPGTYGQGNVLSHELNAGFTVFDPAHYAYDLRLLPTSVAKGYGSPLSVIINTTK